MPPDFTFVKKVNKTSLAPPDGGKENFILKLHLAVRKEDWLHLCTPEEVLEALREKRPEGLFLYHPRWAVGDWDGAEGDQPLVDKAVILVLARAGFAEGKDYRRLASGGKGIRVVTTFLTQSEEEAKLIEEHIYFIAEETWVKVDKKPNTIKKLEEELSNHEKEQREKIRELDCLIEKKDWAGVRKIKSKLASLDLKIDRLKEKINCYDAKNKRVKASLFLDKAFGNRKQLERILGWDEIKKKWGRLLKVGQNITSVSQYRRLCNPPRDKAKAVIRQAKEILPSEIRADEKLKRIMDAQKKRKQLLNKAARKKFNWIFPLLEEEVDKILAQLERTIWETQIKNIEEIEELALTVFLATKKRIRNKLATENTIGLIDRCPVCQERDKAYIKRINGRYFLRCHKGSCTLNQSLVSYCIQEGLLSPKVFFKDKKAKRKSKEKQGWETISRQNSSLCHPKRRRKKLLKYCQKKTIY